MRAILGPTVARAVVLALASIGCGASAPPANPVDADARPPWYDACALELRRVTLNDDTTVHADRQFAADGNLIAQRWNSTYHSEYAYVGGRLATSTGRYPYDVSFTRTRWRRDADGVVDRIETYARATDADDGSLGFVETWSYDDRGFTTRITDDDGADGAIDETWDYAYDDRGCLVQAALERGNHTREIRHYLAGGDCQPEEAELDLDGDGTIEQRETYAYDQSRRLTGWQIDDLATGASGDYAGYWYDDTGQLVALRQVDAATSIVDDWSFAYACAPATARPTGRRTPEAATWQAGPRPPGPPRPRASDR